jgi:AcrR family transcriptional regulator
MQISPQGNILTNVDGKAVASGTIFQGTCRFYSVFYCIFKIWSLLGAANGSTVVQHEDDFPRLLEGQVLEAALEELRISGIDEFTLANVAKRAQVDLGLISAHWHNWRVLLMDAMLSRSRVQIPTPENGDLPKDLAAYAASLLEASDTAQGRQWFHRNLPNGADTDLSDVRADFWSIRFSELVPIMLQAAQRGQIRNGIDPLRALQAFSAAVYYDVIFGDRKVPPDFADLVIDIFLHGVLVRNEE